MLNMVKFPLAFIIFDIMKLATNQMIYSPNLLLDKYYDDTTLYLLIKALVFLQLIIES